LPLKNKTNKLFLLFICCRLGRSRIEKKKSREKERKVREKHKKNPRKKLKKMRE
jgi:hypothetical protein